MLETLEVIGSILFLVQALIPALQKLAALTANKSDDALLVGIGVFIHNALAYLPAQRLGHTLEEKELLHVAKELSIVPTVDGSANSVHVKSGDQTPDSGGRTEGT